MGAAEGQTYLAKLWAQPPQGGPRWPPPRVANWPKLWKKTRQKPEQAQTAEPRHLEGVSAKMKRTSVQPMTSNLGPTPPAGGQTAKVNSTKMKMALGAKTVSMNLAAVALATFELASKLWKMHQGRPSGQG